ncbi:hypothetical protein Y032_0059g3067 [Ancylostoma ceylanicum]|uniref:Uncharacterized protein n=1 Tax=Ancylostoma ceylanicum TaxID=53326 RepID=A0A016U4B4_9BILA|nr:hypothetical protein Y032_0059g3067 [Ancylostoma ceylanicum]
MAIIGRNCAKSDFVKYVCFCTCLSCRSTTVHRERSATSPLSLGLWHTYFTATPSKNIQISSFFYQSPIDIRAPDVEYVLLDRMEFVHYDHIGPANISNNGHTSK